MASLRPRLAVAFDASGVSGALVARAVGRSRLRSTARVELPPGALTPSALGPNLQRPHEVGEALAELRRRLGDGSGAALVLPDGVGRALLLDVASGIDLRAFVRFRLAPLLPYPAEEAVIDVLRLGRGRVLGAAVRRSVVAEYEQSAAAAGFLQEGVHLAPLLVVAGLLRRGAGVHVILGDAALSLAAFRDARLAAFRTRRRDPGPGEAERLLDEAERTALLAGGEAEVTFVGPGARDLVERLAAGGRRAEVGPHPTDPRAGEAAWISGMLA
ncbi:MAG TPA: hypothetical protein VLI67_06635 [Vicinamibacteria bacterium]|nr:hypothetical protein [Vicinamibacteria bacterium]